MIDKSGEISTIEDIQESIGAIINFMKNDLLKLPLLAIYSLTIKRCLTEYLIIRKNVSAENVELAQQQANAQSAAIAQIAAELEDGVRIANIGGVPSVEQLSEWARRLRVL